MRRLFQTPAVLSWQCDSDSGGAAIPFLPSGLHTAQLLREFGGREAGAQEGRVMSQTNRLRLLVWFLANITLHNTTQNTVRKIKPPPVL